MRIESTAGTGPFTRREMLKLASVSLASIAIPDFKRTNITTTTKDKVQKTTGSVLNRALKENKELNLGIDENDLRLQFQEASRILGPSKLDHYWRSIKEETLLYR